MKKRRSYRGTPAPRMVFRNVLKKFSFDSVLGEDFLADIAAIDDISAQRTYHIEPPFGQIDVSDLMRGEHKLPLLPVLAANAVIVR